MLTWTSSPSISLFFVHVIKYLSEISTSLMFPSLAHGTLTCKKEPISHQVDPRIIAPFFILQKQRWRRGVSGVIDEVVRLWLFSYTVALAYKAPTDIFPFFHPLARSYQIETSVKSPQQHRLISTPVPSIKLSYWPKCPNCPTTHKRQQRTRICVILPMNYTCFYTPVD